MLKIRKKIIVNVIDKKISIKSAVLERYKPLSWCGHVRRMNEERLPQKMLEWCPLGRRRKGRPRNSWMPRVTT